VDAGDSSNVREKYDRASVISYNPEKDFYRGIGGELRMKAEGLFKKAKEKGISIEEVNITTLRENKVDFPGIGMIELPAYIVTVKGRDVQTGQVMVDGKQMDYYNRYQRYAADRISGKNTVRDERGRAVRENNRVKYRQEAEMSLNEWELFEIGQSLIDDKEFGMEKTITGACDRVIRKLMGENDWLYPEEARLLDEEFNLVQDSIARENANRRTAAQPQKRKATERQINYLKARVRNSGLDANNEKVIREVIRQSGFGSTDPAELSTSSISKVIDAINDIVPKVKDALVKQESTGGQEDVH
jgi:hypothetical protein